MSDAAAHATLTLAKSKSGLYEDGSRKAARDKAKAKKFDGGEGALAVARGFDPFAAQPGHERVEPVLQHEQLEVAAGAVKLRARRERARAGRPRRLVEDRRGRRSRPLGASWIASACSSSCCRVLEPAVDRGLGGDDPARAERPEVVGLGLGREVAAARRRSRRRGCPPSTPRCGSRRALKYGSRVSGCSVARIGAPWKATRWLSDARIPPARYQRLVDLDVGREVDVDQRPAGRSRARGRGRRRRSRRPSRRWSRSPSMRAGSPSCGAGSAPQTPSRWSSGSMPSSRQPLVARCSGPRRCARRCRRPSATSRTRRPLLGVRWAAASARPPL